MKLVRKAIASAFILLLLAAVVVAEYVGSKNSNKYHKTTCQWAQKIKSENRVTFKTAKDAEKAGYIPCKVCKPMAGAQETAH
jgi:methylphosphotriester-DNA--protein-cysteine methyltransferase